MSDQSSCEFDPSKGSTVVIIGAGPSGLAACKAALEEGLQPLVLEKAQDVGGLWRQDETGKVWRSMCTNLSKYTCAFSDMPWPADAPAFPSSGDVNNYLRAFAEKFNLMRYVSLKSEVLSVEPAPSSGKTGSNGWVVTWQVAETRRTATFASVIAASGIFEAAHVPALQGLTGFSGETLHASSYKDPSQFVNKTVLVVGAAFSGADIAAEIASAATSVTVAAAKPVWYLPRYINGKPLDLTFYSRASAARSKSLSEEERNSKRHSYFQSLAGERGYPASVPMPNAEKDLPYIAITDSFLESVHTGRVTCRASAVNAFDHKDVIFSDGFRQPFDVVIFATGYRVFLPYLPASVKDMIEFDGSDWLQPVILQETVWRPELENIAFIGLYRGPYFTIMELQARWAAGIFSGRLSRPAESDAMAALDDERAIRKQLPRPQFPHADYVGMAEALARWVGVHPQELMDGDEEESAALRQLLLEGPLLPFHYRLVGFSANPSIATAAMQECAGSYSAQQG